MQSIDDDTDTSLTSSVGNWRAWMNSQHVELAAEILLIAALTLIYVGSYRLESPVNGMGAVEELFGQDSRYILRALQLDIQYEWNARNHVLHHWLSERGFHIWRALFGGGLLSAFAFSKAFSAATGALFLTMFRQLCVDCGWRAFDRCSLLVFAGLSASTWFHFAAFETWSLTLAPLLTFAWALRRRVRLGDQSLFNHCLLIGSCVLMLWARTDQWRAPFAVGLLTLLPSLRALRRGLYLDLVAIGVLAPLGLAFLISDYLGVDWASGARTMLERKDFAELQPYLMQWDNLRPHVLWRCLRADGLYALLAPLDDGAVPFGANTRAFWQEPRTLPALLAVTAFLVTTFLLTARRVVAKDAYQMALAFCWIAGWLFYAWFDPHEPFLWTVHFAVLTFAAFADSGPELGPRVRIPLGALAVLTACHNAVYLIARYQA
ncbi:MAG TPA: hypothetical protein VLC09_11770 [Polyangiaceae bacterium]|nr:hypothetical protein [Polyangiaceae bacterium]